MSETRPVPHIHHTQDLANAAAALMAASVPTDALKVSNPMDLSEVRDALQGVAAWFDDPDFYFVADSHAELKAAEHLVLLATLLREHLRAGNTT